MKRLIFLSFCILLSVTMMNVMVVSSYAQSNKQTIVSDADGLKTAIENAEDNETILLEGGRYVLEDTYKIENISKNITMRSCEGETAVITTAYKTGGWEECTVNGVRAFRTDADGKKITSLFSGSGELQISRFPESGFNYLKTADTSDQVGSGQDIGSNGFYVNDVNYNFESPEDITVGIVHQWVCDLSPMVSFDGNTGLVKMSKYTGRPIENGDRYYFENVKECLDKSGEWCFDSSEDKIYYIPEEGETVNNLTVYASYSSQMISINNCSGITFENIEFADTAFECGDEKYLNTDIHTYNRSWASGSYQGGTDTPGAITVTYSGNINFRNCEFRNIGCTAVRFFNGAKDSEIGNCIFDHIGASAVFAGGKFSFYNPDENSREGYAENITVTNCEIENYGEKTCGACGITVAYCDTADISHNEIHDGYYTAISVGYTWLYIDNPTQYISVKDNLIYNIGHNMLSDLGGIYLLGVQEGTVVSGNVVHDVTCYDGSDGYAGNGIYLDSGCEFMTVENNLVFNCTTSAYNNTLNKNNTVRNNIFALCGQSSVCLGVTETGIFTDNNSAYYNNIILTDNDVPAIEYLESSEHFCGNGNIIWNLSEGDDVFFCTGQADGGKIYRQSAEIPGYLASAEFEDPGFTDAEEYDFTFTDDSYAVNHGFEVFDYNKAGTLDGTVIGFGKQGGQTQYNGNVSRTAEKETKVKFFQKTLNFFYKIADFFRNIIKKIAGYAVTIYNKPGYISYYEKRSGNETTEQIAELLDKVKTHTPSYRVDETRKPFADDDRIQAIYFDGEKCNGRDTEIFAYLGIPENASSLNPVPAVVLVHGGGVHAQADWVQYWVDKGYAAIAIDGFGQEPIIGEYNSDSSYWVVNPDSHITYAGFDDCDKEITEQWFYYFLTDIILGNNILRADNRIATNEIGISGISWGGMATSVAMCYDDRFAFAIPVYGCPYAYDSKADISSIFTNGSENIWEASLMLDNVKMPVMYINGNDDPFFSPDCTTTAASYTKNSNMLLLDGIGHGGFKIEEAVRFANEVTGKGTGNIHITGIQVDSNAAKITYTLPADIKSVKVKLYTRSDDFEYANLELTEEWDYKYCTAFSGSAKVTIPSDTEYYYIEVSGYAGDLLNLTEIAATTGIYKFEYTGSNKGC